MTFQKPCGLYIFVYHCIFEGRGVLGLWRGEVIIGRHTSLTKEISMQLCILACKKWNFLSLVKLLLNVEFVGVQYYVLEIKTFQEGLSRKFYFLRSLIVLS